MKLAQFSTGYPLLAVALARDFVDRLHESIEIRLLGENGGIEGAFGRKIFEEQRLAGPGGLGDLLGGRAAKSPRGEE